MCLISLRGLILALVAVTSCLAADPPFWGGNPVYTVNVSMLYDKPVLRWNFTYYYDWNKKAERYEHHAPQADEMCLLAHPPFTINDFCVATFAEDGWSYIEYPSKNWCCKCENSFGAIKYDWLQTNSTFVGIETVNNVAVTHWTKKGAEVNNYYSTVDRALPVRFFELKSGQPKSWDFDLKTYTTTPHDPDLFKPKCTNLCGGYCPLFRK